MQDATISVVHSTINRDIYTDRLPARAASLESPTFSWQSWKGRGKFEVDTHQKNQNLNAQNETIDFAKNVCHFYRIALAKCFPHAIFRSVFCGYVTGSTVVGLQISAQRNSPIERSAAGNRRIKHPWVKTLLINVPEVSGRSQKVCVQLWIPEDYWISASG